MSVGRFPAANTKPPDSGSKSRRTYSAARAVTAEFRATSNAMGSTPLPGLIFMLGEKRQPDAQRAVHSVYVAKKVAQLLVVGAKLVEVLLEPPHESAEAVPFLLFR